MPKDSPQISAKASFQKMISCRLTRINAYVRFHSRTYTPPFSMKVLPKPPGRLVVADEILRRSARYSQDLQVVHQRLQEDVRATNALGLVAKRRR